MLTARRCPGQTHQERWNPRVDARLLGRLKLESRVRDAIDRNLLDLHYQPQVAFTTGRTAGVGEALLRWGSRSGGPRASEKLIRIAESSRLIDPLGDWVLRRACADAVAWRTEGLYPRLAVNVSPRQLRSRSFAKRVLATLAATGFPPPLLNWNSRSTVFFLQGGTSRAFANFVRRESPSRLTISALVSRRSRAFASCPLIVSNSPPISPRHRVEHQSAPPDHGCGPARS